MALKYLIQLLGPRLTCQLSLHHQHRCQSLLVLMRSMLIRLHHGVPLEL